MLDRFTMRGGARALLAFAGLMGALGLAACDDDDETISEPIPVGAVATFNDVTFNFSTLRTFAMPDTVVHFTPVTGVPIAVSRQYDQLILDRVRQNLLARGYTQDFNPGTVTPDFVVLVGATATTNYNAWVGYAWYSAWGFYSGWGWYLPGFTTSWGIIYPWYPVVGVTAYERGTVIVDLIPVSSVNPAARTVRSAWAGVGSGLLNGALTANDVAAAIDQMFILSPYLVVTTAGAGRP